MIPWSKLSISTRFLIPPTEFLVAKGEFSTGLHLIWMSEKLKFVCVVLKFSIG